MSAPPRIPLHIGDYLKDTPAISSATWEHHGIFMLSLFIAWNVPGARLPTDETWLALRFGCTAKELTEKVLPIIHAYYKRRGKFYYQKRVTKEHKFIANLREKQRANAKLRWEKEKDVCDGNAKTEPRQSQGNAPTPTPTPTPEQEQKERKAAVNSFGFGKAGNGKNHPNGHVTVQNPANRLAIFQRTLAESFPDVRDGWRIVGVAADPTSPDYLSALAVCQAQARRIGKGWPLLWPKPDKPHA